MDKEQAWRPPAHLSAHMRAWISGLAESYEFAPQEREILVKAGEAWDLAEKCRVIIERGGLTYLDRFKAPRARPEVAILRDARIHFIRAIAFLNLGGEEPEEEIKRHPRMAPRFGGSNLK